MAETIDRHPGSGSVELPRYRSHKEVQALRIVAVERNRDGSAVLTPAEDGHAPFRVPVGYVEKHDPQPGGYYVRYRDGYESFSPAEAFENGYMRL